MDYKDRLTPGEYQAIISWSAILAIIVALAVYMIIRYVI
jgi:hypothetical protein